MATKKTKSASKKARTPAQKAATRKMIAANKARAKKGGSVMRKRTGASNNKMTGQILSRVSKLEAHDRQQDKAIMALAEHGAQLEQGLAQVNRRVSDIDEVLQNAVPQGYKRFKIA